MKIKVDGIFYDTENAEPIGSHLYESGQEAGWWQATLYQKRNGSFFLYGEGGWFSPFRKTFSSGHLEPGIRLLLLTPQAAALWMDTYCP